MSNAVIAAVATTGEFAPCELPIFLINVELHRDHMCDNGELIIEASGTNPAPKLAIIGCGFQADRAARRFEPGLRINLPPG